MLLTSALKGCGISLIIRESLVQAQVGPPKKSSSYEHNRSCFFFYFEHFEHLLTTIIHKLCFWYKFTNTIKTILIFPNDRFWNDRPIRYHLLSTSVLGSKVTLLTSLIGLL